MVRVLRDRDYLERIDVTPEGEFAAYVEKGLGVQRKLSRSLTR
jgi:hypothetical protein